MTHQFSVQKDIRQSPLPQELHFLHNQYPRASWEGHENFKEKTRNWMGAHQMFRQLAELNRENFEKFLDKSLSEQEFTARLSYYGGAMVNNLHGHHSWEDRNFFPELSRADNRFDRGLEILEADHEDLDMSLDHFVETANRAIKLMSLDENQAYEEAAKALEWNIRIENLLKRHLADEEDLIVPIIIHHKLRG